MSDNGPNRSKKSARIAATILIRTAEPAQAGWSPERKRITMVGIRTERENLLELIDDQHPPLVRGRVSVSTDFTASAVRASSSVSLLCAIPALCKAARSEENGSRSGVSTSVRKQPCANWLATSGISPARTTEDLPLPDGPVTSLQFRCRRLCKICSTNRSRPKRSLCCVPRTDGVRTYGEPGTNARVFTSATEICTTD